ncbi:MAG: toll/interleukin-1 receptor domain-containing protein, partial [Aldersonia sp.]|nr:toll/interleukin-1 receptor domain-containing protein [Aldersonia sp.]
VVFRYGDDRAEVIEDYRRRRLSIRLGGSEPRVMLAMIDRALAGIHRSFPRIKFDRRRPCTCAVCADSADPTMYLVSELEDFARTGDRIQCRASRELMDPAALLADLWKPSAAIDANDGRVAGPAEVFVSYKRGGAGEALVDDIERRLGERGLIVRRDRNELRYRDSIQKFMRRLGGGKFVVVVLNEGYLKSKNCMFELTEVAGRPDFAEHVYPIVLSDAKIFDAFGRLGYVKYWEGKRAELDQAMREVGQENLQGIREELDLYEKVRNMIAGITDMLADMNTLTPTIHGDRDFAQLYEALDAARRRVS